MSGIDLAGSVAIVTGGASGIGLATAMRLSRSGARVAVWDANAKALDECRRHFERARCPVTQVVDVAVLDDVERGVRETVQALGKVDVLVNSAGITGPNLPTWEYPADQWSKVLQVNLTGTFHCCRSAIPYMRDAGYGRIVNVASVAGKEGNPNASAYSASKAGAISLTKSLGKELASSGVLVNCVTPGAVRTPLFDQMSEQHVEFMLSKIPMGRFGTVDEIAAMIVWLASSECSFSTGATFDLSGGRSTY